MRFQSKQKKYKRTESKENQIYARNEQCWPCALNQNKSKVNSSSIKVKANSTVRVHSQSKQASLYASSWPLHCLYSSDLNFNFVSKYRDLGRTLITGLLSFSLASIFCHVLLQGDFSNSAAGLDSAKGFRRKRGCKDGVIGVVATATQREKLHPLLLPGRGCHFMHQVFHLPSPHQVKYGTQKRVDK